MALSVLLNAQPNNSQFIILFIQVYLTGLPGIDFFCLCNITTKNSVFKCELQIIV